MASLDHVMSGGFDHLARRHPGWPQGGDHLVRRDRRGLSRGAAHASEPDCRRPRAVARKRPAARRQRDVGIRALLLRGADLVAGGLAAVGRNPGAASSVRRRRARAADQPGFLRCIDRAGATGVAIGRDRHGIAAAGAAPCDRPVARTGTGRIESGVDEPAGGTDGCLSVRRSGTVRRPPRLGRPAGADPAGTAWRAARGQGLVDRRRGVFDAEGNAWRCGGRWLRSPLTRPRRRRATR